MTRGIWMHAALLVLAAGASVYVWTRDEKTTPASAADVTVWAGRKDDVQRIVYESKGKKVTLEAKTDAQGRWYLGKSETMPTTAADGGPPPATKIVTFVAVTQGEKVAEGLATLKALREIGKIDAKQADEFGLKDPALAPASGGPQATLASLIVVVGGKEHHLTIGGTSPGGADRYVRDEGTGIVYAIKGDVTHDLELGDSALSEREPHGWKDADLESAHVTATLAPAGGGPPVSKSRHVLRRGPESKRIWADPSDPEKADETASNWLAKVDRLRPTEYLGEPATPPQLIVRLEYGVKGVQGSFLELAKLPSSAPIMAPTTSGTPPKSDYVIRSERTRLWSKVFAQAAEQVEQDLGSVVK